ncbi:Phosphatidylserine decarboxylase proenzyme 1, mitochondrial [Mycena venus]|uniref:Phosphatidylserine decarboxylase proenzyme 1, mitochondrial n=1 Tax=Mycena venus TaxID=2733690 RepID=A0A8H7DB46_9AGAR|nr:Phosphatidylserine decarboxylase proenzyme 1, mitochondrial [Mycena venus]
MRPLIEVARQGRRISLAKPAPVMLFSKKTIFKGRKPLRAASRVLNASFPTASSAFTRCWVHGTNTTSAIFRTVTRTVRKEGLRRVYSTKAPGPESNLPGGEEQQTLYRKVLDAWTETPVTWYPIPIALGALVLVAVQYRRKTRKEVHVDEDGNEVIRLKGPWQIHVLGALPLRNMSRLWGYVNSLELPVWFRPYGFRLYAATFGCNLDEIEPADLTAYPSLGAFFYRALKDGARPVADSVLVSPADGKVLHFGTVQDLRVEQVKGITYSLDALLGVERPDSPPSVSVVSSNMPVVDDREFANVNGIEYTLDQLLGGSSSSSTPGTPTTDTPPPVPDPNAPPKKFGKRIDASVVPPSSDLPSTLAHDASVAASLGSASIPSLRRSPSASGSVKPGHALFFAVIYLAPGDYHRFHSPTAWVVEKRRHFVGELFSVSPYVAKRLENLFVLNERGGAAGTVEVNFDQTLRTNVRGRPPPPGTYTEAVYSAASPLLNGQPLTTAQEMGGFCLGSTIVLVFEAPADFEFAVKAGQKVKVGEKLGDVGKAKVE